MAMDIARSVALMALLASANTCAPISGAQADTPARLGRVDDLLDHYDRQGVLSGTLFIKFEDGTIYERGINLADDAERVPNRPETLGLISSVSKGYTAAAVVKLEELGALSVTDPVSKFFPEYPVRNLTGRNGRPATLHHLLNHTSGIPDAYEDPRIDDKLFRETISMDEIIDAIKSKRLEFDPGARFSYSNTGYILLGEVVRRVSGKSFAEFAKTRLFDPLHLNDTHIGRPEDPAIPFAISYERIGNTRVEYAKRHGIRKMHITDVFTDGNIVSTVKDMAMWASGLASGRVLSTSSLEKIYRDYGAGYGYGWDIEKDARGETFVSHNGGWIGYLSYVIHGMKSGETLAYILNQEMPSRHEADFKRSLRQIVFSLTDG